MKFKIDIEASPEEMRRLVGLPDIAGLQDEMIAAVRDKMIEGIESFDAASLLKAYMPEQLQSLDGLRHALWDRVTSTQKGGAEKKKGAPKKRAPKKGASKRK